MIAIASIVYKTDPKSGYVYAYESFSYRDPVTKRPRSKQKYLGRVDPVTKEIRPKGENGKRNRYKPNDQVEDLRKQVEESRQAIQRANETIESLQKKLGKSDRFYEQLKVMMSQYEQDAQPGSSTTGPPESGGVE